MHRSVDWLVSSEPQQISSHWWGTKREGKNKNEPKGYMYWEGGLYKTILHGFDVSLERDPCPLLVRSTLGLSLLESTREFYGGDYCLFQRNSNSQLCKEISMLFDSLKICSFSLVLFPHRIIKRLTNELPNCNAP